MVKIKVESIKVIESYKEYEYSYYLLRSFEKFNLVNIEVFGLEIICTGLNIDYYEKRVLEKITFSKERIKEIINCAIKNKVSPIHLNDIMKDNINIYIYEDFDSNVNKFYNII